MAFFNEQPEVPSRQKAPIEQQPRGPYQLTRSRRKTLSLAVDEGQLQVRAPLRASIKDIESFIEEKKTWIDKQFQEDARRQNEKICLYDGASLQILDRNFSLSISRQINSAKRSRIDACMQREQVSLQLAAASDAAIKEKADKLFRRWLTLQAAPYLEQGTLQLASNMGLGNLLRHVRYRYTRSKWGHCTSEGDIQYNPAIVLAPTSVVDYIIAHEV
ncbi:MAG: DUF45 domain-containing protein, partial [Pseudomonadales bacterium]|nr:DUF45 domain-containing protein [Pseudomonadales bacterium]